MSPAPVKHTLVVDVPCGEEAAMSEAVTETNDGPPNPGCTNPESMAGETCATVLRNGLEEKDSKENEQVSQSLDAGTKLS